VPARNRCAGPAVGLKTRYAPGMPGKASDRVCAPGEMDGSAEIELVHGHVGRRGVDGHGM